jgi:5'-3' exoribonuclease 1
MVNLGEFYNEDPEDAEFKSFKFGMGEPFPSLAQLLSVLPPQSAELLPPALGELMLHDASPLISYYPSDFTSDPNGKRQSWEAVVEIPFIDGDLLLETVEQVLARDEKDGSILTPSERRRNQRGKKHIFKPTGYDEELPNGEAPKKARTATKAASKAKGITSRKATTPSASSGSKAKTASKSNTKERKKKVATKN